MQSIATLGLVIAIAVLLSIVSVRYPVNFDWTQNGRHSLSQTSVSILEQIEGPIHITAYAREGPELRNAIRRYIERFQEIKPDISLSFTNPDTAPDLVRELGIRINGELVFQYKDKTEHVRAANEDLIINTLVQLWRGEDRWVAYITGHGERSLMGMANHDLGEFGNFLSARGYNIQPINLAEIRSIPDNTSVAVLAGPRVPLLEGELQILLEYLQHGGNLLWLLDPDEQFTSDELTEFLTLEINNGTIIDVAGSLIGIDDPTITMITTSLYGDHPTVSGFEFTSLFPKAVALTEVDNSVWDSTPILMTGDHTWLEKSDISEDVQFNEESDVMGPFTIGIALNRSLMGEQAESVDATQQRVIVIGDGDFLSNTYLGNAGNLDLGTRLMEWISNDEKLVNIPVRAAADMQLTLSNSTLGILGILFLAVLPLLSAGTGVYIWWRRRRI